jgi:arginine decarboxylase
MLYDKLSQYNKKGVIPMHMPGHKRNAALLGESLPYGIDITEIDGFDDLHHARSVLKDTADIAARLYGSKSAYLLVNGSTGGILAAVGASARYGDTVIMARNCHKSVYNAVLINGLKPVYIMPEADASGICGSIRPEQLEKAIGENPGAKLVIVTSPTYEGVVSDIKAISDAAHRHNIPVLVDSAHGAHLGFSDFFPGGAVENDADIVIMSLHKTLPALTQCALAHLNSARIDTARFESALAVYQTSSPSYVLLASIDRCLRLLSEGGAALFDTYARHIKAFDEQIKDLRKLHVLCHGADALPKHESIFAFDPGKIVISTSGSDLSGISLMTRLRENYQIELEMAAPDYALAMTSVCDSAQAFDQLASSLLDIDRRAVPRHSGGSRPYKQDVPKQILPPCAAAALEGKYVPQSEAAGLMSLEYIWAYPPGIPFIVPGEMIDDNTINSVSRMLDAGITVRSTKGSLPAAVYAAAIPNTYL